MIPQQGIPQILSCEVLNLSFRDMVYVLDTGATESVSSLAALEYIHLRRTELLHHANHVTVIPGPQMSEDVPFWEYSSPEHWC